MNILILNWRDTSHPLAGGAEISLIHHVKYWQKKGFKITWFASSYKNARKEESVNEIKIIRKGSHYTVFLWFFLDWVLGKFSDTDIIIDCFHFLPFLTPLYIRNKPIIGLINEVAGNVWFDNLVFPLAFIGYKIEPYLIRMYRKCYFITGSKSAFEDLLKIGISRKMIKVINHGFTPLPNTKKFVKEKYPTVLFLGRISKDKGIEDALFMLKFLIRDDKNIKLWVVGKFESKNYEEKVKSLALELRVNNNCIFYGYVDEKKKTELLKRAWLMVHPSTREGWGLNVIEANSVGTIVVGYNVSGLQDSILDKRTGILVESNAESLANGVKILLENKKLITVLSHNAEKWAKNFSWEKSGRESYDFIQKIYK